MRHGWNITKMKPQYANLDQDGSISIAGAIEEAHCRVCLVPHSCGNYEADCPGKPLECETCGKKGAEETTDPFESELYDREVEIIVCSDCYDELADAI